MSATPEQKKSVAQIIDELVKRAAEARERKRQRRLIDPDDVEIWSS